ncbi:MAG: amidohydrolase family protein [Paludibacteraceae bacterium]|nr:amidohydrolase family protein [Paludibacteraceae bacterium]
MTIYRANLIDTPTPESFRMVEHGYIAVTDEGRVEGVYTTLPDGLSRYSIVDYGDRLLIPAFNDLHVHAPQYRNLGLALDLELLPWLQTYTFPEESKFTDLAYAGRIYRRFVHELWMQGTMRSSVFATSHFAATKCLADIFLLSGMGAKIGQVAMNRDCPEALHVSTEQMVQGLTDLKHYLDENGRDGLVEPIVTPRFVPSCTRDMLEQLGKVAQTYHLPVQSHLSENLGEIELVKQLEPASSCYGEVYNRYGLFGQQPTLMAHCCHTDGEEFELLKRNGVIVVHCPMSNSNLASGVAPVRRFLNAGIQVALGTDVSGGHNMSMLRAIQYAIQVSKVQYTRTNHEMAFLAASEAFYLATKAGGAFFGKVGCFEPGYEFDALLIDDGYLNYDNYTLQQRMERYIYLGDDRDIRRRFCRGKELCEPVL